MKCTNYFAFVHAPCCSCKDIMQPDRLWSVPSKASVFFCRYPLHRLHVRLLFCLKSTVQKMQSSLWYPWEINLFRWTTTVFIYFLASCWWAACTAGGCFRLQTGRQAGIYFCCSNWKRKKMGREETKQVKEWKFNQSVLLKVWLGEGWIYSCLAFPLSTHHVSLQLLTSLLSLTHFCVCVCVCMQGPFHLCFWCVIWPWSQWCVCKSHIWFTSKDAVLLFSKRHSLQLLSEQSWKSGRTEQ